MIRRGLISGEIGRGSFVQTQRREPEPPYLPERLGEVIDLSILKPVCEPMHLDKLKQALTWLGDNLPASSALTRLLLNSVRELEPSGENSNSVLG